MIDRNSRKPGGATQLLPDRWIKCISVEGNIRGVAIQAAGLVRGMAEMHQLQGPAARALGEAVMGALLVASYCKPGERVNLNIRGTGLVKQALVDAHPDGKVRGYIVGRPHSGAYLKSEEGEDIPMGPWGAGTLSVLRTKRGEGEQPYIGTVPLITGHLAKDLTFYWAQSEQIPSAVGIAVNLDDDQVTQAGAFLVQALPGASSREIRAIESHIHELESLAKELSQNTDAVHLLSRIFESTAFMLLEERPIRFECHCSWERARRALALVGVQELESILKEDGQASVHCDFCTKEYRLDGAALNDLIQKARTA